MGRRLVVIACDTRFLTVFILLKHYNGSAVLSRFRATILLGRMNILGPITRRSSALTRKLLKSVVAFLDCSLFSAAKVMM